MICGSRRYRRLGFNLFQLIISNHQPPNLIRRTNNWFDILQNVATSRRLMLFKGFTLRAAGIGPAQALRTSRNLEIPGSMLRIAPE
jgi:hypothetical protein